MIVGKPDTPTPIFSNEVKYILVNPIWRVPQSIVKKEMMPQARRATPNISTQHGFKVKEVGGQMFVEQPPGEDNALGHILFMFPNEHSVYLHDTPSRALFATDRARLQPRLHPRRAADAIGVEVMGGAAHGWPERKGRSHDRNQRKARFSCPRRCRSTSSISQISSMKTARCGNAKTSMA